ncbi:MAG: hypothetical protein NTV52_19485 [Acidobacteria bacterium]|nr:hypothetical protein [Acidobacteriota bacterium]
MKIFRIVPLIGLALLAGCADAPKKAATKEPVKAPEAVTGQWAFFHMYVGARAWAADAQGVKLTSVNLAEVKGTPGKSGAWQVTFASASRQATKTFTYSAVDAPGNIRQGTFGDKEDGLNPRTKSFPMAALKIDSDAAYKVAAEKTAEYLKKNPNTPVTFLLEVSERHSTVAWRVIYGESVGTSAESVFVDATSGQYLETRH